MPHPDRDHAIDHVVPLMFENRSFDNPLGHLHQPGEVASFEGVLGRDLSKRSRPGPSTGAERKVIPYSIAPGINTPDPDLGEEYQHVNTQLFGIIDPPENRNVLFE